MPSDLFDQQGIVRLFENDSDHMLANLGILFSTTADSAESDGCDQYWWRTAGLTAVIGEIDRRRAYLPGDPRRLGHCPLGAGRRRAVPRQDLLRRTHRQ